MTPFAVGAATTSPLAGRLVGTLGRRVTLVALGVMMTGTALAAWLVTSPTDTLWWTLAPAMFLAGVGGGGVISPNFTLTLAEVPPQMGGAAGGALQTGQRIGSALGAALLMTVYQVSLGLTSAPVAARAALVTALLVLSIALATAVRSARHAASPDPDLSAAGR
jgi:MFS family permease